MIVHSEFQTEILITISIENHHIFIVIPTIYILLSFTFPDKVPRAELRHVIQGHSSGDPADGVRREGRLHRADQTGVDQEDGGQEVIMLYNRIHFSIKWEIIKFLLPIWFEQN